MLDSYVVLAALTCIIVLYVRHAFRRRQEQKVRVGRLAAIFYLLFA